MEKSQVKNIADLARLAGVSAGTVSRALSGSSLISRTTRDRISALATAHGFRPNQMARNLRIQKAGAIGVVVPLGHERAQHLSDPFFMQMVAHLADALADREQNLLLSRVIPRHPDWLDRLIASGHVDGVIVLGQSDQSDVLDEVAGRYRPLVVWGARLAGQSYCSVGSDNEGGGALAARHLLERECETIAFLGDPGVPEVALRLQGCCETLQAQGIAAPHVVPVHLTPDAAYRGILAWLKTVSRVPDGIFAASDVIAMNALRALSERGFDVPRQVKVIGFDDLPLAAQTVPSLTSIHQDFEAGARALVDLLFRRISGEDTEPVLLPTQLVARGSTDAT